MKPPMKNVHGKNAARTRVTHGPGRPTIQRHGPGGKTCRTPACGVSHSHGQSSGYAKQNLNQVRSGSPGNQPAAARPVVQSASTTPNYRVQTPIPLGQGSQQIRATIHGTPQVAGSVELSTSGGGKAYISNLKVDQQHRRRGVAAQLIDAAINTARRQGFKAASLEARPSDNGISPQALVAMYRRQGFKSVGRTDRGSPLMERKL